MATDVKVLTIDGSSGAAGGPDVSVSSLRDAVLKNPSIALDALRYAIQGAGSSTTPAPSPTPSAAEFGGSMPLDTPIFKMLLPEQAKLLTPAAAKLTKEDLLDLAGVGTVKKKPEDLGLTLDDLKSVQDAFHAQIHQDPAGLKVAGHDINCCCTPCCCCTAAAVTNPMRRVA